MNTPLLAAANAAARFGLVALLSVGALSAQTPDAKKADPQKEEVKILEKFEVTGSRIKRLDYETPAPVEIFSMAEIEAKGYVNIGDFIQSLPFNSGTANSIYQTASFQRGAATTNIRGRNVRSLSSTVAARCPTRCKARPAALGRSSTSTVCPPPPSRASSS